MQRLPVAEDVCEIGYVATAYYVYDLRLMEKFCRILGRSEREEYYKNRLGEEARAEYECPHGKTKSAWKRADGKTEYTFTVPEGTCARVRLICNGDADNIGGIPAVREGNRLCFDLTAGEYTFTVND